jgi:hypothetical protein
VGILGLWVINGDPVDSQPIADLLLCRQVGAVGIHELQSLQCTG